MEYDDIIHYLSGQAGQKESARIEAWIAESKENKMAFHRWKSVWESAGAIAPTEAPDVEKALEKILPNIAQSATVVPLYRRWQSIAAAIIMLLGISYFGWRYFDAAPELLLVTTQIGQTKEVTLPDGSVIWLDEASQLSYPENFKKNSRKVALDGTAFFDVKRDEKAPFTIDGAHGRVEVLGTSFVVHSHADSADVRVEVKSGKVALSGKSETQKSRIVLTAGEQGVLEGASGALQKDSIQDVNYLAWQSKVIEFDKTPIKEVEKTLEKIYKKDLIIENPDLYNCLLTARFDNESLETILETLAVLFSVRIVEEGQQYRIEGGKGC